MQNHLPTSPPWYTAPPPRVPLEPMMDTSKLLLPPLKQQSELVGGQTPLATEMQEPQQSTRTAEKIEKLADVEVLQNPNNVEPCRSRRLEELKNKKKDAQDNKINLSTHHHRPQRNVEVQTLNQELVLACIQMYVKVTQRLLSPNKIGTTEIPYGSTQCNPQQGYRRTHGNVTSPTKSKIQQAVGRILHKVARMTGSRSTGHKQNRYHHVHQVQ